MVEGGRKVVEGGRKVVLGPQNCFYWGAAAPQTPCCSWGASSPPDPLAGGLQPPCPPAYREAPPLGLSIFFGTKILVPGSWYQDLGTKILVPRSWYQDLGIKKKRRAREAEPLGMQGGTGGCRPPARGSGGLEAPQEEQGVWGAAAPQ